MALTLGARIVANNARGTFTPNFGLLGTVNGHFVLNVTGEITVQPPLNAFDGSRWTIVINNPNAFAVTWTSSYQVYCGGIDNTDTTIIDFVSENGKHYQINQLRNW